MKSTLLLMTVAFIPNSILASDLASVANIREIEVVAQNASITDQSEENIVLEAVPVASTEEEVSADLSEMDVDSHSWIQQGLPVTENSLNMAIAGQGFFWVIDSTTGALKVTRDGRFQVDVNGNLVHWENGDQILKYTDGGYSNIRITDSATLENPKTKEVSHIKRFDVTEDGTIVGTYESGDSRQIAKLVIVDFENPRKLKRVGQHLFVSTIESGLPNTFGKNLVFGKSVENLDEDLYELMGFPRWQNPMNGLPEIFLP